MNTTIACPGCRKQYRVPPQAAGKSMKCPACQTVFAAPAATTATAAAEQKLSIPRAVAAAPKSPPVPPADWQRFGVSGPLSSQPALFPESVPAGPDPLANHVVHDPGFVDVDVDLVRRQRLAQQRKSAAADATAKGQALESFEKEMEEIRGERATGYLGSHTLFSFEGRINRQKFWISMLLVSGIASVLMALAFGAFVLILILMGANMQRGFLDNPAIGLVPILLLWGMIAVVNLVASFISLALHVKRYHDLGKSGLWLLLWLVPFGALWTLIECGFFPGQKGKNLYGPDPLL